MYVDVDVHKRVCRAAMVNEDGAVVDECSFRNSKTGIEDLMMRLDACKNRMVVAVESTANLWIPLYDHLEAKGIRVVLSNPYKTRAIERSGGACMIGLLLPCE
jgi:transposase